MDKKLLKEINKMTKEEIDKMLESMGKDINSHSARLLVKSFKADEVKLIPLGDIHLGEAGCDTKLLKGTLDYIKKSDSQVIGMGDYINAGTRNSVSDIYSETMNPMEEYETMIEYLEPIKENIWGFLVGNHEYRIWRESGINVAKFMAKELDTKYLGFSIFTKLKVKNQNYSIYATHGSSGAWTPEGKLRAVRKLGESFDADVYLMGHVHDLSVQSEERRAINYKNKVIDRRKRYYVITGHFLNYEDSYAEMRNMKPGKKGIAKIKFFGDRWDCHVSI